MLIVDDHPVVAQSTRSLFLGMRLADEIEICHTAPEAFAKLQQDADWLRIWLDVDVPGAQGLSLIRWVHEIGLASRSAVITANRNPEWQAEVEGMGFLGYVPKATGFEAFQHAISHIVQGRFYFENSLGPRRPSLLTRRQIDILRLVSHGRVSKEIARQLGLTPATVNNYITAILDALRARSRSHAVALGIEYGYLAPDALSEVAQRPKGAA
jgi:DNA-binding NarL/FixJ family response regulator